MNAIETFEASYTTAEVQALTGLAAKDLRALCKENMILCVDGNPALHPKAYIDGFLATCMSYPLGYSPDVAMARLFWLQWQHRETLQASFSTFRERERQLKSIVDHAKRLVRQGRAYSYAELSSALGVDVRVLRAWAQRSKFSSVRIGLERFTSRSIGDQIIEYKRDWVRVDDLARTCGVDPRTVALRIDRYGLTALKMFEGVQKISPASVAQLEASWRLRTSSITAANGNTVSCEQAAQLIGVSRRTFYTYVELGVIATTSDGCTKRVTHQELRKWRTCFATINSEFSWLQHVVKGETLSEALTAKRAAKTLGVTPTAVKKWASDGLLPYFVRSFTGDFNVERYFLLPYVEGLFKYAGGMPRIYHARSYKQLCQLKGGIV